MKRMVYVWIAGMVLAGLMASSAIGQSSSSNVNAQGTNVQEPSLGSYARNARKDKKPASAKRFDNDNLPKDDKISVVGDAAEPAAPAPGAQSNVDPSTEDKPKVQPGQSAEDRQKVFDVWQQKITAQQGEIDQISHELDLNQREYRLRAAAMYGDAGERLRNQAAWDKEDADYKQKIADQQKALDDAKQKLSDLQEDARKSGVPNSALEPQQEPVPTEENQP